MLGWLPARKKWEITKYRVKNWFPYLKSQDIFENPRGINFHCTFSNEEYFSYKRFLSKNEKLINCRSVCK